MADDITLAEMGRTLKAMREDLAGQLVRLSAQFDNYLLNAVYAADRRAHEAELASLRHEIATERARVDVIESKWDRVMQVVVGFVVLGVLGAVFGTAALGR